MARPRPTLPRPAARVLQAVGAPVGEVARYWSQEATSLRRGLVALGIAAVATLVAGIVLSTAEHRLAELPGLLVLLPAALAVRGTTFGAFGARLGTAIHVGQFDRELRPGSWLLLQVEAVAILTPITSLGAALLAKGLSSALGLPVLPVWDLVAVSVLGGLIASLLLMAVTVALARAVHVRSWNMDDVGAPSITAAGDLLAVPALLVAAEAAAHGAVSAAMGIGLTLVTMAAAVRGWFHPRNEVREIVRESVAVLLLAATGSILAGLVAESRLETLREIPALLIMLPGFLAMFGSLGGILSSRLTSKLHLGIIRPNLLPGRAAALDVSVTFGLGLALSVFVGATSWAAAELMHVTTPPLLQLVGATVLGGMLGTALLSIVSYVAATSTYRFGLDPDNHAIPVVTSAMDFLGMLCLLVAIAVLRIG